MNTLAAPRNYQDALRWLYARTRGGLPRDPERTRALLARLGISMPPRSVHVVGTNGKGTVTAMIAAAHRAAGHRCGRFMSPHVEDFRERIAVDESLIGEAEVTDFVRRIAAMPLVPAPAFFELSFALALEHFDCQGVEVGAIEAGVGARLDATIVMERVEAVVVTSVGLDHLDTLGPTLEDIARDKACAIRPGVPVVCGVGGRALEVLAKVARSQASPFHVDRPGSELFELPGQFARWRDEEPWRWRNARLAAAALRLQGGVPEAAISEGLLGARLPARAESFCIRDRRVVLDGAHNPSAARALRSAMKDPYVLVFGALPRKLGEKTLAVLEDGALRTFVTRADGQESTLEAAPGRIFVAEPGAALDAALDAAGAGDTVLVAGSLHLAGQLRPLLRALQDR